GGGAAGGYGGMVQRTIGGTGPAACGRADKRRREVAKIGAVEAHILGDVQRPVEVALANVRHRNGEGTLHRVSGTKCAGSGLFVDHEIGLSSAARSLSSARTGGLHAAKID